MNRKKKESEPEAPRSKDPLAQLEAELEVVKRFHLRAILEAGKNLPASISPELLKQIASYLKVVEKLIQIISLRKKEQKEKEIEQIVNTIWRAFLEVPSLRELLKQENIQKEISQKIKSQLKRKQK